MKSSNRLMASILAGALASGVACSEPAPPAGASGQPSGKPTAVASAKPVGSSTPSASASTPTAPAQADANDVLRYLPATCEEGRVYVNVEKLLRDGAPASLEAIVLKGMPGEAQKKNEAAMKALEAGGIQPFADVKEFAECLDKVDDKNVFVVRYESKADKPADTLAKAIEAATGKAPTKEDVGGVTFLRGDWGLQLALVGKNILVISGDKAIAEAAARGPGVAPELAGVKKHVVWAKIKEDDIHVIMTEAGSDFDFKLVRKVSGDGGLEKDDAQKQLAKLEEAAGAILPELKPLVPAAKSAKIEVAGGSMTITTKMATSALPELLAEIAKSPDKVFARFDKVF